MKRKRPAYTLLEMLAIIAAIVILMALSARHIRILAADVPRSNRDYQVWIQTQDMLRQLKQDVEQAVGMTVVEGDVTNGGKHLHLQQTQELVVYLLTDGRVVREAGSSLNEWDLPYVNIRWEAWDRGEAPYAVEITTWTERTVLNKTRRKYDQSFVYFQKTGSRIHENP